MSGAKVKPVPENLREARKLDLVQCVPEELLDARQWERMDENTLYEMCVHFINVGIANKKGQAHITEAGELVVTNWEFGAPGWNSAVRGIKKVVKSARQSRAHRKQVQADLLNAAATVENKK